jgi:glycosyltransferase involved in cell wall biosynthesis
MNPTFAEHLESGDEAPGLREGVVPSGSALIPDVGVLALVPDAWHWQWQPRHQVMTRLAQYFPVVWMNPAEYWRKSLRLRNLLPCPDEVPIAGTDFVVHTSTPYLPLFYSPRKLANYTLRKRLETGRQTLIEKGCKKIALYIWRPEFAAALDNIPADLSCYHIDDEYTFSTVDSPISEEEKNLIARVDQVFIHSPALLEKKGRINPHTSFTPNGVDFDAYSRPIPEPDDLRGMPHPRIGYSGHIKRQLDWQLLLDLTARHPNWFFAFVGSTNAHPEILGHLEELSRRENVRFLGSKSALQLAAYPQHFDVCIMPYRKDDYTKYIYPLKLHEYLASGRPVVGTPIPSLEPFRESVRLPESVDQWSVAIDQSLAPAANTMKSRAARQALAKSHDWNILVRQIALTMAERLGPSYSSLLERSIGSSGIVRE